MQPHRQLAAILFTDIVGYTAAMQRDEQQAVAFVKKHRTVLEGTVKTYNGEVIEYFGDGSLCIFPSATEAVRCALHVQEQMQAAPQVPLRVGVHIGEIFFDEKRVMGDGVNLASRIQALGVAGSVLFSTEIANKIRNHQEFKTVSLGFFKLKNVEEPMEIFALANDGLAVPPRESMSDRWHPPQSQKKGSSGARWVGVLVATLLLTAALFFYNRYARRPGFKGKDKSIAVLPFQNISNDTTQDYFSDGITEEIITQLSKIADLRVISRTSVMPYKNAQKNVRQIARELGVSSVLEGSVRKEGNNVRITAQLIDAGTDRHLWSENYDRPANEIFAIQSEVAERIAREMNATLTAEEMRRLGKGTTKNVAAYEDYLRAKRMTRPEAERLLLRALERDSTFAPAWASQALFYTKMPVRSPTDRPFYIRKSLDAALTAVEYGPELSESHMVLGDVLKTVTLNPALSLRELNKAIALNPSNAEAYVFLAFALTELGRFGEAETALVKAERLAPSSTFVSVAWICFYQYSRNPEKLLAWTEKLTEEPPAAATNRPGQQRPGRADGNWRKVWYYFLKDQYDSLLLHAQPPANLTLRGIAYARTGKTAEARRLVDSLRTKSENENAFSLGIIHAWLGEKEKALAYLNLAYRLYDYDLIGIKVDKLFDPLRNEEGFNELLRKMGVL